MATDPYPPRAGQPAHAAADRVARDSYGRLIAFLAARSGDIAAAEDALADAFCRALDRWPQDGVPDNPDAWLLVTARRSLGHVWRHDQVRAAAAKDLADQLGAAQTTLTGDAPSGLADQRLGLMLACAHPGIDAGARTPLMLQAVLGLDAGRIASAFLVSPGAMAQRLVRAKQRIKVAAIPFAIPDDGVPPDRVGAVLDAIYGAFAIGWGDPDGDGPSTLTEEAIWLARVVVRAAPDCAEAFGLLALMLFSAARSRARRAGGVFVPLDQHDVHLWDGAAMGEADRLLAYAGTLGQFGRYQCEAAIQAVHAERRITGVTRWPVLVTLYAALWQLHPGVGVGVGRAAAVGQAIGPAEGLALLNALPADQTAGYQPFHATRAHLLGRQAVADPGLAQAAAAAYARAIGLTEDTAVRAYLIERVRRLGPCGPG